MALFPFRRLDIDPLAISMAGVKLGERLLQIGVDDASLTGLLAAKTGLSGTAAHMVATDDEAVKVNRGAKKAGVLVEVRVGPLDRLPFDDAAFDLVVIHSARGQLASADSDERTAALQACRRVLRPGGRLVTIEAGTSTGLRSMLEGFAPEIGTMPWTSTGRLLVSPPTEPDPFEDESLAVVAD